MVTAALAAVGSGRCTCQSGKCQCLDRFQLQLEEGAELSPLPGRYQDFRPNIRKEVRERARWGFSQYRADITIHRSQVYPALMGHGPRWAHFIQAQFDNEHQIGVAHCYLPHEPFEDHLETGILIPNSCIAEPVAQAMGACALISKMDHLRGQAPWDNVQVRAYQSCAESKREISPGIVTIYFRIFPSRQPDQAKTHIRAKAFVVQDKKVCAYAEASGFTVSVNPDKPREVQILEYVI